ncbi:diaminopimelate decarboxylase family protein [Calothrix sp. NIES-3974]|uniref:diaminopimelate decarboxylase family protein n=1 Tax=Calothrix sp. NIES-3974 TaxID=2005462 RepID=UPI000B604CCB|nr:decarboxylase [Calothrix sp. NIES-3974]BAZ03522.1 Orn/DAP/Arg decarboxylase 2 [Calothrix sp. NIES-3974]
MISPDLIGELLSTYGSPLYVYDGDRLQKTISHITTAIPYPRTQFHFAAVTNGNINLLKIFTDAGWGLHANTPGDIYLGLKAGVAPEGIVYSGSNLNQQEMEQVLDWGVKTLNLDSLNQLELCCQTIQTRYPSAAGTWNLGLRLNLPEITGDSRIGVHPREFEEAVALAKAYGCEIRGLHFYRGTGTNATTAFTEVIDKVIATAQLLPDWQYLDFGGGFGYPYHHDGVGFDWQIFGSQISQKMANLTYPVNLIIEPGRAAIAGCAYLFTKVVSVKWQGDKQILGVDTTVANLSVPSVHGGYREIRVCQQEDSSPLYTTDVCGNTTYSRDYLGRNCQLPKLKIGDAIAILDVGAYGYAMSSHFLHRPRPAEVLLTNQQHRLIRQREDYSVLLTNQVV